MIPSKIHESHQMILTPVGTTECALCWACLCHSKTEVFSTECEKTFAID